MAANFSLRISGVDSGVSRVSPLRDSFPPLNGTASDPVNEEDQQAGKRSRGENVVDMDVGPEDVAKSETTGQRAGDSEGMVCDGRAAVISEGKSPIKPSYHDLLAGNNLLNPNVNAIPELDVEILEEDVHISVVDGTPTIDFSTRVHDMVDATLANSVIVRLLGRMIGYNALLNRIRSLWSPSGEMALVDLDNGYYLVRFAKADDVNKVLLGGPWLIYGNYLTVQPWSRNFPTEKEHPDHIVVWARLPGLSYRYYTKSMFHFIANAIGKIIKIDYNTKEGKRGWFARIDVVIDLNKPLVPSLVIDAKRQIIEYEGLPMICYSCGKFGHTVETCKGGVDATSNGKHVVSSDEAPVVSKERFGPWMKAPGRKPRKSPKEGTSLTKVSAGRSTSMPVSGMFDVLSTMEQEDGLQERVWLSEMGVLAGGDGLEVARDVRDDGKRAVNCSEPFESGSKEVVDSVMGNLEVASTDMVIPAKVSLNSKSHTTVRVLERRVTSSSKIAPSRRSDVSGHLLAPITSNQASVGKKVDRKGSAIRKKSDSRSSSKAKLADSGTSHNGPSSVVDSAVVWRENTSFDQ
ncbi:hypothetical protein GQ457_08G027370 [Hibiscus cannabinus]